MLTSLLAGTEKAKVLKRSHQSSELVKQINQWDESNPTVAKQMAIILVNLLSNQFNLDAVKDEENKESSKWTPPNLQQK